MFSFGCFAPTYWSLLRLLNACSELFVHISLLFSGLLGHGCVPEIMPLTTVVPIPKGCKKLQTSLNLLVIIALL